MAVSKIEEYRQQNGVDILKVILKPTAKFPNGFFYAPADAIDLVNKHTWFLSANRHRVCVTAMDNDSAYYEAGKLHQNGVLFHTKLFELYNNYKWQGDIDHRDMIEYDNIDQNLEPVTSQQNSFNKMTRGYMFNNQIKPASFRACIVIDGKFCRPYRVVRSEDDACSVQNYLEQVYLREKLGNQYYMFDFLKYRRGHENILDLERTGQISEEEAVFKHIMGYCNNAWYYLRYGLQDYFQQYHIPIPEYRLDEYGFMVHPITGQKLCPF